MTITRNQVADALLAFGSGITWGSGSTWATPPTRKFKGVGQFALADRPVLIQIEPEESVEQRTNLESIVRLQYRWIIWTKTDTQDVDVIGAADLNDMIDAIEAAFKPVGMRQTQDLGGAVAHAFINGSIFKDSGDDTGEGLVSIPITVLRP